MGDLKTEAILDSAWSGGRSPFSIGKKKFGMWLFIVSDALTFSAFFAAYAYSRMATPDWPRPFALNPAILFSLAMTVVLMASSVTMLKAVRVSQRGDRKKAALWMVVTIGGGVLFMGMHLSEWLRLFSEGATLTHNPWGTPLFSAVFFGITGMHMVHVLIGVVYLGVLAIGYSRGKFSGEDVEVSGLYWYFVDVVWLFVFSLIYLTSVK